MEELEPFSTNSPSGLGNHLHNQLLSDNFTDNFLEPNSHPVGSTETYSLTEHQLEPLQIEANSTNTVFLSNQRQIYSATTQNSHQDYLLGNQEEVNFNGLRGEYYDNSDFTDSVLTRIDENINFNWDKNSPDQAIEADTFSVRWTGQIEAPTTEKYTFYLTSDDGVRLWINGNLIINNWTDHAPTENQGSIELQAGEKYDIRLDYFENKGGAVSSLSWSTPTLEKEIIPTERLFASLAEPIAPGAGTGLIGEYFDNSNLTNPVLTRTDETVDFSWKKGSPDRTISANTFSVRWKGKIQPLYDETYTFATNSDDGVRLWVNGELLIDNWTVHPTVEDRGKITLEAGKLYDIKLEYYEHKGVSDIQLLWSSASQLKEIIPTSQLYPIVAEPPEPGKGTGLQAEYFDNSDFTNLALTRIDPTVDFDWGWKSPDRVIKRDTYSVRWTGKVQPLYSDYYTFSTFADDGVRLTVNNELLIDDWTVHPTQENNGEIWLKAGQLYDLDLEYYENEGRSDVQLLWSSELQDKEIIPTSQLYPVASESFSDSLLLLAYEIYNPQEEVEFFTKIFDADGVTDLATVDLWLQKDFTEWIELDDITEFIADSNNSNTTRFTYDLPELEPGRYQLLATVYNQANQVQETLTESFTILSLPESEELSDRVKVAIENSTNLDNYDLEALAATTEWVVSVQSGLSATELANTFSASNLGATGHIPNTYIWEFSSDIDPFEIADKLASVAGIEFAYPLVNLPINWNAPINEPLVADGTQWHLDNAKVTDAWQNHQVTGKDVIIGVVDDGFEIEDPQQNLQNHWEFDNYRPDLSYDFDEEDNYPSTWLKPITYTADIQPDFPEIIKEGRKNLWEQYVPLSGFARELAIDFEIEHESIQDLEVTLISPEFIENGELTRKEIPLENLINGENKFLLTNFQDVKSQGKWQLKFDDTIANESLGELSHWSLTFKTSNLHGTAVAGVAAADGNNGNGGSGVAPDAAWAGLRLGANGFDDKEIADAWSYQNQQIDIYNNSWGPGFFSTSPPLALAALENNVRVGRESRGNIYVFAAGNDGELEGNVNYNSLANSRQAIAVGAIGNTGEQASYSAPGSSLLVSAPSSGGNLGITTTYNYNNGNPETDYINTFGGTSAAAPLVSGVIALMLEANPNLTQRDIQHILVETAQKNDDEGWSENQAGYSVNYKYGFGAIDAEAAVETAIAWQPVGREIAIETDNIWVGEDILDYNQENPSPPLISEVFIPETDNFSLDWVEVVFNAGHSYLGDLNIVLTSPDGTQSILAEQHLNNLNYDFDNDQYRWVFSSARHWGEDATGTWQLSVSDRQEGNVFRDRNFWKSWQLNLYGSTENTPPEIDTVATMAVATENQPFTITYAELLAASDATDADGDAIVFQIEETISGTLFKNDDPVIPGETTLAEGEEIVWIPDTAGEEIAAFTVKAFDGIDYSINTATTFIETITTSNLWNYTIDPTYDSIAGDGNGNLNVGGTIYEIYGMGMSEDEDSVWVAINTNLPITGRETGPEINGFPVSNGNIGWGDLFFDFSGLGDFQQANGELFGIRFAGTNDSQVGEVGVYRDVTAVSVVPDNAGWSNLWNHNNQVQAVTGEEAKLGDLAWTHPYYRAYNSAAGSWTQPETLVPNVIQSGTRIGDLELLETSELIAAGFDLSQLPATGDYTIGFKLDKSLLPGGEFIATLMSECNNDAIAHQGQMSISSDRWNASFLNIDTNLQDPLTYDFSNPVATLDLGQQGENGKIELYNDWGIASPDPAVQNDYFAMDAWTRTNFDADKLYKITTKSDDGTWFRLQNTETGEWIDNLVEGNDGGDWIPEKFGDRTILFKVPESGEYDFHLLYHEQTGNAKVDFNLEEVTFFTEPVNESQQWKANFFWFDRQLGNTPPADFQATLGGITDEIGIVNLGSTTRSDGNKGITFDWQTNSPNNDLRLPDNNFIIDASTETYFEAGRIYQAQVRGDDGFQLLAQNQDSNEWVYITPQKQWQQAYGDPQISPFSVPESGIYDFHFYYYEERGNAILDLAWEPINFTGTTIATIGANIRSGPGTSYPQVDQVEYGTSLTFDKWIEGEDVNYIDELGTASSIWYRLAGTDNWISAAIVDGGI
ncbi:MAG: PA14 domain-containing protein [Oscillatoria sp. PMC 1068.18]|nr:PA14 domain-containing protein [Oscillatoria sp. PMC 1076.18]MEC4988521.1 PA14 domain-containing protein [Oscillatoria sp. PMC 1068.18]